MKRVKMNHWLGAFMLIGSVAFSSMQISASSVEPGKSAQLNSGKYVGGAEIPAGTYVLECETNDSEYGIVWLSSEEDNLDEGYPSKLYESVSRNEHANFFISLHEGATLHVPFPAKLTAVDYMSGAIGTLYTGTYVGGEDLPAGRYQVSYATDDNSSGIIWLADVDDNLDEEYPSMLYEYINRNESGAYYISLAEGRTLKLPFACDLSAMIDELSFDSEPTELLAGQYVVGEDIPAGMYDITCRPTEFQNSGIVWASAPSDNLKEKYPSLLYEYVNAEEESFHVSLEEGGRIDLPFPCTFVQSSGGVVFN